MRAEASRLARLFPFAASALALTAALSGCTGKGVGGTCADIPGCGGDITGTWKVNGFCQFDVPEAPSSKSSLPAGYTTPQTPVLATAVPPTPPSGDWCQALVYRPPSAPTQFQGLSLYPPPQRFTDGMLTFNADHSYMFVTTNVAHTVAHLTPSCLTAYGGTPSCSELTDAIVNSANPNYQNVMCTPASDGGCDCGVDIAGTGSDNGTWLIDGSMTVVVRYPTHNGDDPQLANFCVSNQNGTDVLTLNGYNGASIGSLGLRTLVATRVAPGSTP
jgi:hypothetical protein